MRFTSLSFLPLHKMSPSIIGSQFNIPILISRFDFVIGMLLATSPYPREHFIGEIVYPNLNQKLTYLL